MFLGHFAVAFASKRVAPALSLGLLFAAAQLADLVWPVLVLAGIERVAIQPGITAVTPLDFIHYPWSHSLAALALWGVALGVAHHAIRRSGWRAAAILAALVVSHWVLDFVTHRPDMPIAWGDSAKLGLGAWNSPVLTHGLELGLFAAGVLLYARTTRPVDRAGRIGFLALVAFFLLVHGANALGPPPPSPEAVAWTAMAMWILVAWAHWVDRHRAPA